MIRRVLTSIAGLLGLALTLVGIPAALLIVARNPIPASVSWGGLAATLTQPDNGTVLRGVLAWIGWIAWAVFAIAVILELISQLAGRRLRVPGFALPQIAARPLVAAALAVFAGAGIMLPAHAAPATAAPTAPTPATHTAATQTAATQTAATQTAATAAPVAVQQDQATPSAEAPQASQEAPAGTVLQSWTVRPGDTLWDIAEHVYGDGHLWTRIAAANASVVGVQGERILQPGEHLVLPDAPTQAGAAAAGQGEHTVRRGETLSSIARDELGDPDEYPVIAKANAGLVADPDRIDVGWRLTIPTTQNDAAQAAETQAPEVQAQSEAAEGTVAPAAPVQAEASQAAPSPVQTQSTEGRAAPDAQAAAPAPAAVSTGQDAPSDPVPAATPLPHGDTPAAGTTTQPASADARAQIDTELAAAPYALGAAGLLAAGLVGVLAKRRRQQTAGRRPGHRARALDDGSQRAVTALRQAEAPLTVAHLDRALRTLAGALDAEGRLLPEISVIRLDDARIDAVLASADTAAPAPWRSDPTGAVWTLHAADSAQLLDAARANDVAAPFPALVTIGTDPDGAHILVDMETLAALCLQDPDPDAIIAALAFELATASWADDITVTLVGCCPELPAALGVDRASWAPDMDQVIRGLELEAAEATTRLTSDGLDAARQGRHGDGADEWTPHVVLSSVQITDAQAQRLAAVLGELPRTAIAAITTEPTRLGDWSLAVSGQDSVLSPLGIRVEAQRLGGEAYEDVCAALRACQEPADEPAPWWDHTPSAARPFDDPTDIAIDDTPTDPDLSAILQALRTRPDDDVDADVVDLPDPHTEPAKAAAGDVPDDDTAGQEAVLAEAVSLRSPTLLLLGEVDMINLTGVISTGRSASELFEPIAYVHLNPDCTTGAFRDAMAAHTSDANGLASRARRLLGAAPDGTRLFPSAARDGQRRTYRLHESITSDWEVFRGLVAEGVNTVAASRLRQALGLVRGRPIGSAAPGQWPWVDEIREEMVAMIVDTAHELCERALDQDDLTTARWAVHQGQLADPLTEILGRDEIRVLLASKDLLAAEHAGGRVQATAATIGVELDPETIELLHEIHDGARLRRA